MLDLTQVTQLVGAATALVVSIHQLARQGRIRRLERRRRRFARRKEAAWRPQWSSLPPPALSDPDKTPNAKGKLR